MTEMNKPMTVGEQTQEYDPHFEETVFVKKVKDAWLAMPSSYNTRDQIPEKYKSLVMEITHMLYDILDEEGYIERSNKETQWILETIEKTKIA
jgi:hypothetical protein